VDPVYRVGGSVDCDHERLSYLGQMGTAALYECDACGGVVVARA
jgi:hypothetical protein